VCVGTRRPPSASRSCWTTAGSQTQAAHTSSSGKKGDKKNNDRYQGAFGNPAFQSLLNQDPALELRKVKTGIESLKYGYCSHISAFLKGMRTGKFSIAPAEKRAPSALLCVTVCKL
jgi:hypothetical protein